MYAIHGEMVFCHENCSDLLWEKIILEIKIFFAKSRLKAKNLLLFWLTSLKQFIEQWKSQNYFFFETQSFLLPTGGFYRLNELEQSNYQLDQKIEI